MSIQSQIDRINGAKNSIKSAISSKGVSVPSGASIDDLPALVRSIPQEGGSGSGIIDVTELPTDDIDEGAVYRVTENYMSANADVWVIAPDEATGEMAVVNIADAIGECDIYVVDTFEDMVATDLEEENKYVLNIMSSDGIAYILLPEIGVPLPLGVVILSVEGFDKGYTQDLYAETEIGIYTTQAQYDTFQRWFIRENGEWKEITAYIYATSPSGITNANILTGDISSRVFAINNLLSGEVEEIDESWFITPNGEYVTYIKSFLFDNSNLKTAIIPHFIINIDQRAFAYCNELTTVTFKGTTEYIEYDAFKGSDNLTTINVPWTEDDPVNEKKPWGATNAQINFNYTEG